MQGYVVRRHSTHGDDMIFWTVRSTIHDWKYSIAYMAVPFIYIVTDVGCVLYPQDVSPRVVVIM